jgi:hypothetical protein
MLVDTEMVEQRYGSPGATSVIIERIVRKPIDHHPLNTRYLTTVHSVLSGQMRQSHLSRLKDVENIDTQHSGRNTSLSPLLHDDPDNTQHSSIASFLIARLLTTSRSISLVSLQSQVTPRDSAYTSSFSKSYAPFKVFYIESHATILE